MSKNAAITTILEQEQRLGLWHERLFGFPSWSIERLAHYRLLKDGTTSPVRAAARPSRKLHDVLDLLPTSRDILKKMGTQRDIWVLSSSVYRRNAPDGTCPCIFTTDLENQLGSRLLFLELGDPSAAIPESNNVVLIDALRRSVRVPAQVAHRLIGRSVARRASPLFATIAPERRRHLVMESLVGRGMYELGLRLMQAGKPKAIFVLDAYGRHIPLQLAARKLNIPVIELQHGMIHESHPGYVLPTLDHSLENELPFPDHLVVFGKHFGELLDREAPRWRDRWSVGGHPWLRPLAAKPLTREATQVPRVVFFSQFENAVQEQVNRTAAELVPRLSGYSVAIKPHPRERDVEQIYRSAIAAGVELLRPSDNSYELLPQINAAITVYSTLAIEALVFPCRSIVLKSPNWSEAVESLVARGYLESATDGEDLARVLTRPPGHQDRSEVGRQLFGIGGPALDFGALIEQCRRQTLHDRG